MRVKKVCRCKTCQKIYSNGIVEICNCGTILGEKIQKAERLSKMFIPGATITFNPEAFQGLRATDNCETVVARKRFLRRWEVI